jgi:hypothetical protein
MLQLAVQFPDRHDNTASLCQPSVENVFNFRCEQIPTAEQLITQLTQPIKNSRLQRRHLPLRLALLPRAQRPQSGRAGCHFRHRALEERKPRQDDSRDSEVARSGVGAGVGEVFRHGCCACLVRDGVLWVVGLAVR